MQNFARCRDGAHCGRVVSADGNPVGKTHKPLQQTWGYDNNSITIIKLSAAWQPIIKSKKRGFCVCELFFFFSCLFWWKLYPSSRPMMWKGAVQNSVGFGGSPLKPGRPENTNSFTHTGDIIVLSICSTAPHAHAGMFMWAHRRKESSPDGFFRGVAPVRWVRVKKKRSPLVGDWLRCFTSPAGCWGTAGQMFTGDWAKVSNPFWTL